MLYFLHNDKANYSWFLQCGLCEDSQIPFKFLIIYTFLTIKQGKIKDLFFSETKFATFTDVIINSDKMLQYERDP